LPLRLSLLYVGFAEIIAILIGLLAGVLPARSAAALEPLDALRTE
jgi:putative ABC transport system permease protein